LAVIFSQTDEKENVHKALLAADMFPDLGGLLVLPAADVPVGAIEFEAMKRSGTLFSPVFGRIR
jgi:hypothetical protein